MLTTTFAYFNSAQDWLWIGLIVLVLFGGSKIPQLARGFGEGIREFKKSMNDDGGSSSGSGSSGGDSDSAAK